MSKPPEKLRIILVKSAGEIPASPGPFSAVFNSAYSDRFAARLKPSLLQIIEVPSVLPQYLNEPSVYLPDKLPCHDVLIAINIHEEILLELPAYVQATGGKAVIVPREDPTWTSPWLREELTRKCVTLGLEIVFPKPFCSLAEDAAHPVVNKVLHDLKIGRPAIRFHIKNGAVEKVDVIRSAPCGDTYFVAEKLKGKLIDDKLDWWASKFWGSYPCLGGMTWDEDYDDLLQHAAGHILLEAVHDAVEQTKGRKTETKDV